MYIWIFNICPLTNAKHFLWHVDALSPWRSLFLDVHDSAHFVWYLICMSYTHTHTYIAQLYYWFCLHDTSNPRMVAMVPPHPPFSPFPLSINSWQSWGCSDSLIVHESKYSDTPIHSVIPQRTHIPNKNWLYSKLFCFNPLVIALMYLRME